MQRRSNVVCRLGLGKEKTPIIEVALINQTTKYLDGDFKSENSNERHIQIINNLKKEDY